MTRTPSDTRFELRLYVSGMTPRSTGALATIKGVCERRLPGRYVLEVIDLYQHPELSTDDGIVVLPTLVRTRPEPRRALVGDLTDPERLAAELEIPLLSTTGAA